MSSGPGPSNPSPGSAAPPGVRRQQAVHDAMLSVDDMSELNLAEQLQRLDEAQQVLAAVLQKSADIPQPGIPGVTPQT